MFGRGHLATIIKASEWSPLCSAWKRSQYDVKQILLFISPTGASQLGFSHYPTPGTSKWQQLVKVSWFSVLYKLTTSAHTMCYVDHPKVTFAHNSHWPIARWSRLNSGCLPIQSKLARTRFSQYFVLMGAWVHSCLLGKPLIPSANPPVMTPPSPSNTMEVLRLSPHWPARRPNTSWRLGCSQAGC